MNTTNTKIALAAQSIATDTTTVGEIINLTAVEMMLFAIMIGVYTDGDYQFIIEQSDDPTMVADVTDVDVTDQIRGNLYSAAITPSGSNKVYRFQLLKFQAYARLKVVSTNTSSGTLIAASAELMRLRGSLNNDQNVA